MTAFEFDPAFSRTGLDDLDQLYMNDDKATDYFSVHANRSPVAGFSALFCFGDAATSFVKAQSADAWTQLGDVSEGETGVCQHIHTHVR